MTETQKQILELIEPYMDKTLSRQIERIVWSAYRLPNKPLQLYTEEENKNLLDLLLKLK
jgi:hypothetical protein